MKLHEVRVHRSDEHLPRQEQLAWKIAEVAGEELEPDAAVTDMVINRVIDNAAVATASLTRAPVVAARAQAEAHPAPRGGGGSTVFGSGEPTSSRVGGLGERRRGTRAGLPRHVPLGRSTRIPATTSPRSPPSRSTSGAPAPTCCAAS